MSDHLVEVPKKGWGNWKDAVKRSRVRFTQQHLQLGEELVTPTEFPTRDRILQVHDVCSPSGVAEMYERVGWSSFYSDKEPVHPLYLLALADGIEGAKDSSIFDHMQYPMAMSPYLLADKEGNNYIFLLHNDREHFSGEFKSLKENDHLPRCTHIWGYPPEKEPSHETHFHVFCLREDRKYGPFVRPSKVVS